MYEIIIIIMSYHQHRYPWPSLSPLIPIVHRFWQVLRATSCILTELLYVGLSLLSCFCSAIWGGPQKEYTLLKPDCHSWWISKMQSRREEEWYAIKFCFKLGKNAMQWKLDLLLWPRDQEIEFPVEARWLFQTQEGQTEQIHSQNFDDPFFDSTGMIYMHWVPTGQTVNKEYYVEVLREFRKRFRRKRPALFKLAQWHFHLDNAPVHNSILATDYLSKMGIKTVPQPPL